MDLLQVVLSLFLPALAKMQETLASEKQPKAKKKKKKLKCDSSDRVSTCLASARP
jgi:hypothetical protein